MELSEYKPGLLERIILSYQKLQKFIGIVHKLGKTKVSLLFIPHNNENIHKVELSYYILTFITFISVCVLTLSLVYSGIFLFKKSTDESLYTRGNKEKIFFLHHDLMADILESIVDDMDSSAEDLNKVTWEKTNRDSVLYEELEIIENMDDSIEKTSPEQLDSNMKIFLETVNKFASIHENLSRMKSNLENSMDYLETRETIFEAMPRGRPLGPGVGLITSTFGVREDPFYVGVGEFHNGVDFASANGTPIYATAPGVVAEAFESDGGLGMHVRINHENGFYTLYGHCSKLLVEEGTVVKRGDIIALVGSTGKATGSHLHYEVHIGLDPAVDPQEFINID